jgi:uncharacterized Ntn-hydrolase superfamily protein
MKTIATFSIAARDPETGEFGVAVQSKFLACGSVVGWARAGAGAIATQANANLHFGEIGLYLLEKGYSAQQVLNALLALDEGRADRQLGIVDREGRTASYTGDNCFHFAGSISKENYTCQGNILVSRETIEAMSHTFETTKGTLARRLVATLDAGQNAGGDRRGRQAAGLLVVKEHGSYGGYNDKMIDLRVDDDPDPIGKLGKLLSLHELYFGKTEKAVEIGEDLGRQVQQALQAKGFYHGEITGDYDAVTQRAFYDYCSNENYEERICQGKFIDEVVLNILLGR